MNNATNPVNRALSSDTILVLTNDTQIPGAFKWEAKALPSLVQFRYLLLEVPSDKLLTSEIFAEVNVALRRGARVVWFLAESTDPIAAQRLIGSSLQKIRPTALGAAQAPKEIRSLATPEAQVSFVFYPSSPWTPLGMWESVESTWLAARPYPAQGVEIVAPFPRRLDLDCISELKTDIDRVSLATSPLSIANRALRSIFLLALIFTISITTARYWQRSINESMLKTHEGALILNNIQWRTHSMISSLTPPEKSSSIEEFFPSKKLLSEDVEEKLDFFRRINMLGAHVKLTKQILQSGDDSQRSKLKTHLTRLIDSINQETSPDPIPGLDSSKIEASRYAAQYYINTIGELNDDSFSDKSSDKLYAARRVINVVRDNFLWASPQFLGAFSLREYDILSGAKFKSSISPRADYLDYTKTVLAIARHGEGVDPSEMWGAYIKRWPSSPLVEDAEFSLLRGKITSGNNTDEWKLLIYKDALNFAKAYPASTLADDAVLYAWRFAIALGNVDETRQAAALLQGRYARTDSAARMRIAIESGLRQLPVVDTLVPMATAKKFFLSTPNCSDQQSGEALDTLYLLANQKPRPPNATVSCGELVAIANSHVLNANGW